MYLGILIPLSPVLPAFLSCETSTCCIGASRLASTGKASIPFSFPVRFPSSSRLDPLTTSLCFSAPALQPSSPPVLQPSPTPPRPSPSNNVPPRLLRRLKANGRQGHSLQLLRPNWRYLWRRRPRLIHCLLRCRPRLVRCPLSCRPCLVRYPKRLGPLLVRRPQCLSHGSIHRFSTENASARFRRHCQGVERCTHPLSILSSQAAC